MFDSVRTRLTVAIAVLAALASFVAVFLGTQFIEADLVDTALDDAVELYLDEDGRFIPFGFIGEDLFAEETVAEDFFAEEAIDSASVAAIDGSAFGSEVGIYPPEFFILRELIADGAISPSPEDAEFFEDLIELEEYFQGAGAVSYLQALIDGFDRSGFTPTLFSIMGRQVDEPFDIALTGFGSVVIELDGSFGVHRYDPVASLIEPDQQLAGSALIVPGEEFEKLNSWQQERGGARGGDSSSDIRFRELTTSDGYTIGAFADVSERTSSVDEMRSSLWVAAAALTALATLATWLLTGRALRPVAAITQRVGDISTGNLDERVPVPDTRDEVNELATTMNSMLDRIERGDRERRQFVSDASHELRTPVAVLKSEAEVALRTPDTTEVSVLAAAVLDESDRMGSMVEDLLTLARGDELVPASQRRVEAQGATVVDLDELVLADINRNRSLPIDRREVSAGRVRGSRDELSRVITHLLDNAARHGRSQIAVGVRESLDHSMVELWVDDDGDGVAEPDAARIFERFVRLDEARDRDGGGAGLGLAVVHSTVTKLGGTVQVLVSPLGGARFLVRLPVALDAL